MIVDYFCPRPHITFTMHISVLICDNFAQDQISHLQFTYIFIGDVRQPQHQHQLLPLHRRGRGHGLAAAPPPPGPPGDLALRHGELSLVESWSRDLVTGSDWSRWAATSTTCSTAGWTVSSGSRPSINKIKIIIVVDKWTIDIYLLKNIRGKIYVYLLSNIFVAV